MPINKGLNYAFGNFYKHSQRRLKQLVRWDNLTYRYAVCVIWRVAVIRRYSCSVSLKENSWESPRSEKKFDFQHWIKEWIHSPLYWLLLDDCCLIVWSCSLHLSCPSLGTFPRSKDVFERSKNCLGTGQKVLLTANWSPNTANATVEMAVLWVDVSLGLWIVSDLLGPHSVLLNI